jgi:hypothetical protein
LDDRLDDATALEMYYDVYVNETNLFKRDWYTASSQILNTISEGFAATPRMCWAALLQVLDQQQRRHHQRIGDQSFQRKM